MDLRPAAEIRLFHVAGDGTLTVGALELLDEIRPGDGWIWLDVAGGDAARIEEIGRRFELDRLSLEDVHSSNLLPKVDDHTEYVYIVLHGLVTGQQRVGTIELDAFIGRDYLLTFHDRPLAGLESVVDRLTSSPGWGRHGPDRLLAEIAEAGAQQYLPLLDELDARISDLEERALWGDPSVVGEVQVLRRDAIVLRRVLGPQRDVLGRLGTVPFAAIGEDARRAFAGAFDHYFRLLESIDASRNLLAVALDTYRSSVAERSNEVMRVLTVFAAIVLPLSLVSGIYGMNIAYLPTSTARSSFAILMGFMAVMGVGLWLYFVWRGFVRVPRPWEVPRAVGLGLVHMAALPVRASRFLWPGRWRRITRRGGSAPGSGGPGPR